MSVTGADKAQAAARLLKDVQAAFAKIDDRRLRELVTKAIHSVHVFVAETGLSRNEWDSSLRFLTAVGQACNEKRQEFILLSDLIGLSTAVDSGEYNSEEGDTPSSVEGPFYIEGSPLIEMGGSIIVDEMAGAEVAMVRGQVFDRSGKGIVGAEVDIWQTAPNRLYAATDEAQSEFNLRGRQKTDKEGRYAFQTVKPVPYSVPRDGPCGTLIKASRGHGMRAAHIHVRVSAPGYKTLTTQICPAGDPYIESDVAFSVVAPLVVEFRPSQQAGDDFRLIADFDFVLQAST
jgi:hydroxyquinol 1,2-dioxygenase